MLHVAKQSTLETQETTTSRRNQFSALYSKSKSENSDYHSTEERSPNQAKDHLQLKALTPEEDEFDPLTSSTIIKGVKPLEPRLEH